MYLSSDGYTDQCNPSRKKFGTSRLVNLFNSVGHLSLSEQKSQIEKALNDHQQTDEQRDDITVIGVRM